MSTEHNIANLILSGIAFVILVRLYFWEYRDYRVMRTRHKLFQLRNELFALGESGELAFDSKGYGMSRTLINGAIRYAHRVSVLHIIVLHFCLARSKAFSDLKAKQAARWEHAMRDLPKPTSAKVESIRNRYLQVVIEQTILSSILLCAWIVPLASVLGLIAVTRGCVGWFYAKLVPRVGAELDAITASEDACLV